jgi:sec-independent protein translocase protein TatC
MNRPPDDLPRMPLLKHLEDLRRCLLRSVLFLALAFAVCIYFSAPLFRILAAPAVEAIGGGKLAFTNLSDPFMLYLKVGFVSALFVSFPFFMVQLWLFLSPALYAKERRWAVPFVFFTVLLFYAGAWFGWRFLFPVIVSFFIRLGADFAPILTVKEYLSLVMKLLLGMGLAFETPTLMFLLSMVGITTARFYLKYFKYAVLVIFVVAAVITPTPDMVTQTLLAVPMLALYLVGLGASALVPRRRE